MEAMIHNNLIVLYCPAIFGFISSAQLTLPHNESSKAIETRQRLGLQICQYDKNAMTQAVAAFDCKLHGLFAAVEKSAEVLEAKADF